jgi:N-acetyl-gamma-glutamyl-phosphate reductase
MSESKIKVGIAGGAGYTGGELIRILIQHPNVELKSVQSRSQAGNFLFVAHPDLLGETTLVFSAELVKDLDLIFLCLSHGESVKFLSENKIKEQTKVICLGQDFRISHSNVINGRRFMYGLPELNRENIRKAHNIANPGCFATAIELALLPFAKARLLNAELHVSGITGSTGAGQSLSETGHFSWRNGNVSAYKILGHQHLAEIQQCLESLQPTLKTDIFFIPYRGNFTRGILVTAYFKCYLSLQEAESLVNDYYESHPFVILSNRNPSLKQVVNSNKCVLYIEKHGETLAIISIIDNLLKGASGQAVQNMNLMFGLPETAGLKLKTVNF